LNGILGLSDLLAESPLNAVQRAWIKTIQSSGRLLFGLANHILDLSRLDRGKLTLAHESFNLHDLLEEAVRVCGAAARPAVDVLCFVHPGVPLVVLGDPVRLQQIIVRRGAVRASEIVTVLIPCVGQHYGQRCQVHRARIHSV
jgi:signal transduction histidine kinase